MRGFPLQMADNKRVSDPDPKGAKHDRHTYPIPTHPV